MGNEHDLMKTIEKEIETQISYLIDDKNSKEYITIKIALLAEIKKEFNENKKMRTILNQKIHHEKYRLFGICGEPEKNEKDKEENLKYFLSKIYNQINNKNIDDLINMII